MPTEYGLRLVDRRPDRRRDEVARGHHGRDTGGGVGSEPEVAIRENAHQHAVSVRDRNARNAVALHQRERVGHESVRRKRDGFDDHPRLGALDLVDLRDLALDRKVAMHHAEPALARQRNRQARLGDRVHGRRDDRDRQTNRWGEARGRVDVVGQHLRPSRHEQDVVEGQAFLPELVPEAVVHASREGSRIPGWPCRRGAHRWRFLRLDRQESESSRWRNYI